MWSVTKGRKGATKEYFFVWVTKMNGLLSYYGERRKLTQQCHLLEKLPTPSFSYLVQLFRFLLVGLLEEGLCLVLKTKVASNLWFSFPSLLHCGTLGVCYIPLLDQPSFFFNMLFLVMYLTVCWISSNCWRVTYPCTEFFLLLFCNKGD